MNCPNCGWPMNEKHELTQITDTEIIFTVDCKECLVVGKFNMDKEKYESRRAI